jgi:hypothetical protein
MVSLIELLNEQAVNFNARWLVLRHADLQVSN